MEDEDKILDDIDKANASSDLVDAFKEPFESDNLSKSMFEALPGVFDDPTFGDFNRTVVGGAVDALDLGLRTIESGVKGGATAINEAKNYITGQDDDRLKRDLINFFVTAGVGGATSGSMRMQKGISEFAKSGKKDDVAKIILAESDAFKNDNLKPVMAMTAKREPSPVMIQKTPKLTTETVRIGQFPENQKRWFLEGDTVTLYHGTSRSSLGDITKGGLKGDKEGLVYASPDVHSATGYGSVMGGEKANKARSGKQVKFNTDEERITLKYKIPKEKFLELIGNPNVTQRSISSRVKLFNEDSSDLFMRTKDNPQFYSRGKPISSAGNYYEGTEIRFKEGDLDNYLVGTVQRVRTPKEAEQMISIFPKPEKLFPKGEAPKGGDYINPATGEVITDRNVSTANIKINPDGRASFKASDDNVDSVGSIGKGKSQIKANLFKTSAGLKWTKAPMDMEDVGTLVSVTHKGKHFYTLETDFTKGVNLKKYPNQKDEPKLRPTVVGQIELGQPVGEISVRGKPHNVYDKIKTFKRGGLMARN